MEEEAKKSLKIKPQSSPKFKKNNLIESKNKK